MLPEPWGNNPNGLRSNLKPASLGDHEGAFIIPRMRLPYYGRGWRAVHGYYGRGEDLKGVFVAMHQL
jgi:hypothetical protein